MSAHKLAVERLYQPTVAAIAEQLPAIGANLATSLETLAIDPSHSRAGTVALQVNGALGLVRRLQEALARAEAGGDGR